MNLKFGALVDYDRVLTVDGPLIGGCDSSGEEGWGCLPPPQQQKIAGVHSFGGAEE